MTNCRLGISITRLAPFAWRATLLGFEGTGEMANRQESRGFGDILQLVILMLSHQTLGIFNAHVGDPVAEV